MITSSSPPESEFEADAVVMRCTTGDLKKGRDPLEGRHVWSPATSIAHRLRVVAIWNGWTRDRLGNCLVMLPAPRLARSMCGVLTFFLIRLPEICVRLNVLAAE